VVKESIYRVLEVVVIFQLTFPELPGRLTLKIYKDEVATGVHENITGPVAGNAAPPFGLVKSILQVGVSVGTGVFAGAGPPEQHSAEAKIIAAEASKGAILATNAGFEIMM
jgi:hypothetical protein